MVGLDRLDEYGHDNERGIPGQTLDANHAAESKQRRLDLAIQSIRHALLGAAGGARDALQLWRIFQERRDFAAVAALVAMDLCENRREHQRPPRPALSELFHALFFNRH